MCLSGSTLIINVINNNFNQLTYSVYVILSIYVTGNFWRFAIIFVHDLLINKHIFLLNQKFN